MVPKSGQTTQDQSYLSNITKFLLILSRISQNKFKKMKEI